MIRAKINQENIFCTDASSDSKLDNPFYILSLYSNENREYKILNLTRNANTNQRTDFFTFRASTSDNLYNGIVKLSEGVSYDYTIYESLFPLSPSASTVTNLNIVDFGIMEVEKVDNIITGNTVFTSSQKIKSFK
jgi:hypothetical protein